MPPLSAPWNGPPREVIQSDEVWEVLAELALRFVLSQAAVATTIPGAKIFTAEQLWQVGIFLLLTGAFLPSRGGAASAKCCVPCKMTPSCCP